MKRLGKTLNLDMRWENVQNVKELLGKVVTFDRATWLFLKFDEET